MTLIQRHDYKKGLSRSSIILCGFVEILQGLIQILSFGHLTSQIGFHFTVFMTKLEHKYLE